MSEYVDAEKEMRESAKEYQRRPKPDPLIARVTPALTPKFDIRESFRWMTPELRDVTSVGEKTVQVKGIALPADVVSKNKRKYMEGELIRAARTLTGKPINLNHTEKIIGNVVRAEYEDGAIEYLGQIKSARYAKMLKERDPRIKGVSVQAGYLHNRCSFCGEKFYDETAFSSHMKKAHGVVDGVKEVHGIIFDGLSLVVAPEVPGVESATIQVLETEQKGALQLVETFIRERGYSLKSEKVIGMGKGPEKAVIQTTKKTEEACRWSKLGYSSGEACVSAMTGKVDDPEAFCYGPATAETKEQDLEPCPEGQHRNEQGECVPDTKPPVEEQEPKLTPEGCPLGQIRDPETGLCVEPEQVINKIDEAYQTYKHAMSKRIYEQLENLKKYYVDFNRRLTALEIEEKGNPHLQETAALEKRLIEVENRLSHIRGNFKGHSKALDTKETAEYVDAEKELRETAKQKKRQHK